MFLFVILVANQHRRMRCTIVFILRVCLFVRYVCSVLVYACCVTNRSWEATWRQLTKASTLDCIHSLCVCVCVHNEATSKGLHTALYT